MQSYLVGQQITKIEDVQKWINDYFASKQQTFYREGIPKPFDKTQKRKLTITNISIVKLCNSVVF